jgi:DNA-binding MarR family transcriptional regulator
MPPVFCIISSFAGLNVGRFLERDVIYSKGRRKIQVAARSLLCYWAMRELGLTATGLAKRLGMTQPAVSYAVSRGEQIAKERNYTLTS